MEASEATRQFNTVFKVPAADALPLHMWSAATATHTMHTAYQRSPSSCFPLRLSGHTTPFRKNGVMARLTVASLFFLTGFLHVGSSISLQSHVYKGMIVKMFCHLQLCWEQPALQYSKLVLKAITNNKLSLLALGQGFQNSLRPLAMEAQSK